jgi:hypothetical protein
VAKLWYGRVRKRKRAYHGEKVGGSSLKRRRDLTMARGLYRKRGRGVVAVGNKDLDHLLTGIVKERGLIEFCLELFVLSIVDVRAPLSPYSSPSLSINIYNSMN